VIRRDTLTLKDNDLACYRGTRHRKKLLLESKNKMQCKNQKR